MSGRGDSYSPRPVTTEHVRLPDVLVALREQLAENAHDHWAARRMSEGWVWGPVRDDAAKTHPDLVPYAELSEDEKEYDRQTVVETLKAILALGYRIDHASQRSR